MGDFERDTGLEPVGDGRFKASLSEDWRIWGPSGGYVASIALRAAGMVAQVARPATFAGHFLSVGAFAEVDVRVRTLKAGRRSETFGVSIEQAGKPLFEALVRTAAAVPGLEHDLAEFPEATGPAELREIQELVGPDEGPAFPFWNNFRIKPVWPERFAEARRSRPPIFREWYRFDPVACFDDPFLDAARALMMIDTASWPAANQLHASDAFTAPNLDVVAWFHRAEPSSKWLLMDQSCEIAQAGLMGTHGRIWSEDGKLLASGGAQLFCIPRAPA